jgi:hypothetical protein
MANQVDTKIDVDQNSNFNDNGFWLRYKEFPQKPQTRELH